MTRSMTGAPHAGLFHLRAERQHARLYGKFGFHPRFLTAIMTSRHNRTVRARQWRGIQIWLRISARRSGSRDPRVDRTAHDGPDLQAEIRTYCSASSATRYCCGMATAGSRALRFAIAGPRARPARACVSSNSAPCGRDWAQRAVSPRCSTPCAALAVSNRHDDPSGRRQYGARGSLPRDARRRGFRTQIQGVTMHRPNEPGHSRPGLFVLDDWR